MIPNHWLDIGLAFCAGWLLRMALARWIALRESSADVGIDGPHVYLSPACYHEEHGQCRRQCPFCAGLCQCVCHRGEGVDR